MANSDNKAFDMMEAVADESRVDISGLDILPEILKGSVVKEKDKRLSVGQIKANKSFDAFMKKLHSTYPDLSKSQKDKLREFWEAGGKPIIEIRKEGEKGWKDINRAFFRDLPVKGDADKHVDKMVIFEHRLLDQFQAETAHSIKYTKKEGESKSEWIGRRERINRVHAKERKDFGENVYGYTKDDKKYFPTWEQSRVYSIGLQDGKEVAVDDEGNVYPDIEVPQATPGGRTLAWAISKYKNIEFDPKTRLGVGGQALTQEFEAHKVKQDSLWNVYNQLDEEGFFPE